DAFSVWRLPSEAAEGTWRLLSPDAPIGGALPRMEPGQRLVLLAGLPPPGTVLLAPGGAPMPLAAPPAALPGLLPLARRGGEPRRVLLDLLARRAVAGEARAAACLRDIGLLAPARVAALADPALPVGGALEAALPDGEGRAFLRGWLRDPLGLVESVALRAPGGSVPVAAVHRVPRPDLAERLRQAPQGDAGPAPGFLAWLPEAGLAEGTAQLGLELRLASGQILRLVAPPGLLPPAAARDLVLSATTPDLATPVLMEHCISPAAARFHAAATAPGPAPERIALGAAQPRRAAVTVVVPLWRNLSFLRFQLAAFARDAAFRGPRAAELVYVLDSPEDRAEAEAVLRGLALLHGLPVTLLVQDRNRGYAPSCNLGAAAGSAPLLLFLNSDVVPHGPGWLGALRARLARDGRLAAVGPKLLYASGAIQHAGLFFAPTPDGEWGSNHYFKGWPRDHAPACRARRVPAVTGAAMLVRRDAFEAVGGFATDYILGDFEDSDLCLRLRAAGGEIGYEPAAELYHLERQSISDHPGHAGTLAALHNRRLHAARWGDAIAALMRRHPHPRG
ncbi:MAG TPA: glycosyltransferase family 2 protein, partial [Acetobacteraceae bacterium]|nr:glycosyltransferase family 2 protein [Acetobacteraceae bacterium]